MDETSKTNRYTGSLEAGGIILRALHLPRHGIRTNSWTEGVGQWHVRGISTLRDEDAPDPGGVVAWVEHVPTAAEIDFDPRCEIIGWIRRWNADIGKVAGTIACWDVQATTKSNGKVSIVTAHPIALSECLKCRSGCTGMLVTECYVIMDEVADSLHPRPS